MTKRITEPNNQVLRIMIAFGVFSKLFTGIWFCWCEAII